MTSTPHKPPISTEWRVVIALTLVAAILRFFAIGRLGLTHFDEGVYALAGLWSVTRDGLNPEVISYAPPGFPILVGLAYLIFGVSDFAPLLVSAVCGVATVPVAAWVARRTFGPGAGGAAAAFTALAAAHIAFSRKALTDSPFVLSWLVALGLGGRFLEKPGFARALPFGLAVGVAQNFKYNGWLAGAVVVLAAVFGIVVDREARRRAAVTKTFGWGLFAAVVAAVVYLPWFLFVENHGGYAALLRHHQSYMQGGSAWWRNWNQQLAQVAVLSGWRLWGALTWGIAWLAAGLAAFGTRVVAGRTRWDWTLFRVGGLLGAAFLAAIPDLAWWGGLAWFAWLVTDKRPAVRVLAAWWLLLSILTPFYHPYARLWLPLHAAGWVLLAGAVLALGPFTEGASQSVGRKVMSSPKLLAQCAAVLVCLVFARAHWVWVGHEPGAFAMRIFFRPTDDLRSAVSEALDSQPFRHTQGTSLRVLARRPVAFYLALHSKVPFRLVAGPADIKAGASTSHEWALADEVLMPDVVHANFVPEVRGNVGYGSTNEFPTRLDPVTLLDVKPEIVFDYEIPTAIARLVLLRPTPGLLSPLRIEPGPPPAPPRSGPAPSEPRSSHPEPPR